MRERLNRLMAKETGQTVERIQDDTRRNFWLDAEAAIQYGLVGKIMGQPPNLRELISSADGVTFWAKHDKAIAELGYSPRGLEAGLRDTLAAEGRLAS